VEHSSDEARVLDFKVNCAKLIEA